jgi:hypothetical protein
MSSSVSRRPYRESWKRYQRLRLVFWLLLLSFFPMLGGVGSLIERYSNLDPGNMLCPTLVWLVALWIVWNMICEWRCPRCDQKFFYRSFRFRSMIPLFLVRSCRHCGLHKLSDHHQSRSLLHLHSDYSHKGHPKQKQETDPILFLLHPILPGVCLCCRHGEDYMG